MLFDSRKRCHLSKKKATTTSKQTDWLTFEELQLTYGVCVSFKSDTKTGADAVAVALRHGSGTMRDWLFADVLLQQSTTSTIQNVAS
jgi:hypothetical protein